MFSAPHPRTSIWNAVAKHQRGCPDQRRPPSRHPPSTNAWMPHRAIDQPQMQRVRDRIMSKPITPCPRMCKIAGLSLALLLATGMSAVVPAALPMNPQDCVRSLYDTLVTTMKDGRTLGQSGRYARLAPVVDRLFDVPLMARLAVGPSWATLSPAQQQQVTDAFAHYISATYADRFDSYPASNCRSSASNRTVRRSPSKPGSSNL